MPLAVALPPFLGFRVAGLSFTPLDSCALVVALAGAVSSGLGLWRIVQREGREGRLAAFAQPAAARRAPASGAKAAWYQQLGTLLATKRLISAEEQKKLIGQLAAAGMKGQRHLAAFITGKFAAAFALVGLFWVYFELSGRFGGTPLLRLAFLGGGFLLGWRIPELVLGRLAARRKARLEQGFPDALDLLVICAEVGLSLDQAIEEVSRQIRFSAREVSEEFAATAAEMRVLADRAQALENLARRADIPTLKSLVATLVQSVRYGTPLAESLRIIAAEMRAERASRIEERAARLPVLLTVPLMFFILPSLMIVIGTPLLLRIIDTLRNIRWHAL